MTTKTKNELMEEIEQKNEEVKRLEKYKTYDQSAEEIKGVMDSYIRAGFSEEQAFTLIQLLLTANLRGPNTSNFYLGRK